MYRTTNEQSLSRSKKLLFSKDFHRISVLVYHTWDKDVPQLCSTSLLFHCNDVYSTLCYPNAALLTCWEMCVPVNPCVHMGFVAVSHLFLIYLEHLTCLAEMKPRMLLETREKAAFYHYISCKNIYLVMHVEGKCCELMAFTLEMSAFGRARNIHEATSRNWGFLA